MNTSAFLRVIPACVLLLATSCASRELPARHPESSAASPDAPAAASAQLTRALTDDPPLPGSATEGWAGLAPASQPAPATHDHGTRPAPAPAATDASAPAPSSQPSHDHGAHHAH